VRCSNGWPEARPVRPAVRSSYLCADLDAQKGGLVLNIEAIELGDGSVDTFLCNHVLEHVDDFRALGELRRVLAPGGRAILTVPVVMTWAETYETPAATDPGLRRLHYGQHDHIRRYGRDFPDRVAAAGFRVDTHAASPADCVRHGLAPASIIFVATRHP
jgi:SAM-dependent methyltransferase